VTIATDVTTMLRWLLDLKSRSLRLEYVIMGTDTMVTGPDATKDARVTQIKIDLR
jgi:hypothetical protein